MIQCEVIEEIEIFSNYKGFDSFSKWYLPFTVQGDSIWKNSLLIRQNCMDRKYSWYYRCETRICASILQWVSKSKKYLVLKDYLNMDMAAWFLQYIYIVPECFICQPGWINLLNGSYFNWFYISKGASKPQGVLSIREKGLEIKRGFSVSYQSFIIFSTRWQEWSKRWTEIKMESRNILFSKVFFEGLPEIFYYAECEIMHYPSRS